MPKKHIERDEVLRAAAEVVRRCGAENLTARAVAREVGCSTQPIYSLFRNMAELADALYAEAKARYHAFLDAACAPTGRYASFGLGFVRFAREERGLFSYLFLTAHGDPADPFLDEIIAEMTARYGMPREKALAFHADMTVFSFGLAMRVFVGEALGEEEIAAAFNREFYALYGYYFPERPRFWEK